MGVTGTTFIFKSEMQIGKLYIHMSQTADQARITPKQI